ncbi:MAG: DUF4129 domain-containing protein [Bacillota bacterium]|nr:DUF4129 domain-containing protein [Bacillota bacterium]
MSSSTLRYVRQGAETLVVACFALTFGPWFMLWSVSAREPALVGLYWRLAAVIIGARCVAAALRPYLARHRQERRLRAAVVFSAITTPAAAFLALAPMLPSRDLDQYWVSAAVLGLLAWLRGLGYGSSSPSSSDLHRHLMIGSISLALCLFVADRTGMWDAVLPQALPLSLAWCAGAVVATSLMRFLEITQKTAGDDLKSHFWPSLLSSVVFGSLFAAGLLTIIAPAVWAGIRSLFPILRWILSIIGAPVVFALRLLSEVIAWLVMFIARLRPRFEFKMPEQLVPDDFLPKQEQPGLPPAYFESLRWVFLAIAVLVVIVFAVRYLLARLHAAESTDPDEMRESFASAGALRQWSRRLRRLMAQLLRRLGDRVRSWATEPRTPTAIYHAVLEHAERAGRPRPPGVTPLAFQPAVLEVFVGSAEPAARILDGFMDEYYGGRSLSTDQVEGLREDWKHMRENRARSL